MRHPISQNELQPLRVERVDIRRLVKEHQDMCTTLILVRDIVETHPRLSADVKAALLSGLEDVYRYLRIPNWGTQVADIRGREN